MAMWSKLSAGLQMVQEQLDHVLESDTAAEVGEGKGGEGRGGEGRGGEGRGGEGRGGEERRGEGRGGEEYGRPRLTSNQKVLGSLILASD